MFSFVAFDISGSLLSVRFDACHLSIASSSYVLIALFVRFPLPFPLVVLNASWALSRPLLSNLYVLSSLGIPHTEYIPLQDECLRCSLPVATLLLAACPCRYLIHSSLGRVLTTIFVVRFP